MWIDRKVYDVLRLDYTKANEECKALAGSNHSLQTTLDWLMVRVTQLERERQQLLLQYTGVKVEIPVITRQPIDASVPIDALPNFDDMGDDQAKKLGIGWNKDGTVSYA